MLKKSNRTKPAGSGKKKLNGEGVQNSTVSLLEGHWKFLKELSPNNNASEGIRLLCDRAMRSYPDNLAYPEQLIVALTGAIALIDAGDLAKLQALLPTLEACLEEINSQSQPTNLQEFQANGVVKVGGDWVY